MIAEYMAAGLRGPVYCARTHARAVLRQLGRRAPLLDEELRVMRALTAAYLRGFDRGRGHETPEVRV